MNVPPKPFPEAASEPTREALLAALAERDRELAEARARQSATAEILRVISQSPTDARPVFESIVMAAVRLLGCDLAFMLLCDGATFWTAALGSPSGLLPATSLGMSPVDPSANFPSRAILAKEMLYLPDWALVDQPAHERKVHELYGVNCSLYLPLLRQSECIGLLTLVGKQPNIFGPGEIAQAESFRDQAGIAIENARLFHETREALERQTATSEILSAIGQSVSDAAPVFEKVIDACERLLATAGVAIFIAGDDQMVRAAAARGDRAEEVMTHVTPLAESITARVIRERRVHHIPDLGALPDISENLRNRVKRRGSASMIYAPMLWKDRGLGSIVARRSPPRPFSEKEQALLQSFADQAAIAIENARLFNETQEALKQQTATADVLKVISRSAFDLDAVLATLIGSAITLCGATRGVIWLRRGEHLRLAAHVNYPEQWVKAASELAITPAANATTASGIAAFTGEVVNIDDMLADPRFQPLPEHRLGDYRGVLAVPMDRDGEVVGVIALSRAEARRFSDRQVALVRAFADQAVIAINNVGLFNETQEALRQQTATADVLKVISRSAFDLQTVFDTLLGSAVELSGADGGALCVRDGDAFRYKSFNNKSPDLVRFLRELPTKPGQDSLMGRVAVSGQVEWIEDARADSQLNMHRVIVRTDDDRALVGVPLLRDGRVEGAIVLTRREPGRFGARAIELAQTFADQAMIAIENVRLFDEVQARTRDLTEALQQQTSTADVLKVISRSAFDLKTVLTTLVESARRLCDAPQGMILLRDGDVFRTEMQLGYSPEFERYILENPIVPSPYSGAGRAALTGEVAHFPDVQADSDYRLTEGMRLGGYRAMLSIPLKRENDIIGVFSLGRPAPGAFSQRQIDLVQTFADQAVIAIENVRLFDEVQARTRDLTEALQQQTATADVLKVISRSAFDLQAVLDTLVQSAARLCDADQACVFQRDGDLFRWVSNFGFSSELVAYAEAHPFAAGLGSTTSRVALEGRTIHNPDVLADPNYIASEYQRLGNYRTMLGVPLLREGAPIGVFILTRQQVRPFTDRQIELVQSFADQAVIAIENVRLFDEVQARTHDLSEALQQQTATADVLKVISRSAFDLQAVLDTLVQSAQRLCNARGSMIFVRDGDVYRIAAHVGMPEAFVSFRLANPLRADRVTAVGRVALTGEMVHLADALTDPEIQKAGPQLGDFRAVLSVPLVREDEVVGIFALNRPEPGLFAPGQVKLVQTFADQAAIAIANVRLFNEVKTKTDDLSEALQQQTATADVLKVISRSAFDLQAVLDTLVESAVSLINASSGVIWLRDGAVFNVKAVSGAEGMQAFFAQLRTRPQKPGRHSIGARVLLTGEVQIVSDIKTDPEYDPVIKAASNARTLLGVPLLRDGVIIGAFVLALHEVGTFTPRQIELVQTFADQAVIAIENVRLFEEVQARTRDLTEALERQTATAEILEVIASSPSDVQPVFDAIATNAKRLLRAHSTNVTRYNGDMSHLVAFTPIDPEADSILAAAYPRPLVGNAVFEATRYGQTFQLPDIEAADPLRMRELARRRGWRSLTAVPLLSRGEAIGGIAVTRTQPGAFAEDDVQLLRTFADQAVIAIENARLLNETREALQQQTATADVLKVISRSAFDLQAVLDTLVESAYRLSGAAYGLIYLRTGEHFECKAIGGMGAEEGDALFKGRPIRAGRGTAAERVISTGEVQSIPNLFEDPEFDPKIKAAIRGAADSSPAFASLRSLIAVPMKRDDTVVGVIVIARAQTGLLPARQLELLQTFADQAVIAIENARLFDEVQARTKELQESLERQQASAEILRVISASPTDVKPVFDAIALTAGRLFDCQMAAVFRVEGAMLSLTTTATRDRLWGEDELPPSVPIDPSENFPSQAMSEKRTLYVRDFSVAGVSEHERTVSTHFGFSSALYMPLLRGGECVGVFLLTAAKTHSFTDKDIALAESFRDQAQIAIENTRLFNETQEALQQQTATADVLKVISRSAFGLKTVLQTLVDSAVRLCASDGVIYLRDGDMFRAEAAFGANIAGHDSRNRSPRRPGRDSITGRVALSGRVEQIPDNQADPEFKVAPAQRMNMRALLGVPLLRDGEVEGVFVLGKPEPGQFSDRAVELVRTFADQAVIAIQNVRLFDAVQAKTHDLEESLQLQTATADVLKVISRSAFDLQAVFDTLIASAVELCGAYSGIICVREGDVFHYRGSAGEGDNAALTKYLAEHPATPGRGSMAGRVLSSGKVEAIPDRLEDPEFLVPISSLGHAGRALLGVPLLGKAGTEGALVLTREEPGYFTDRQIEIVQTFADQAVIAIENVRLFDEVQARTRELAASLDDLRKAQDRLIQSEKLASLGQLTAGIAHEIKNPLNFVNNFSALSRELIDELAELLEKAPLQTDQRDEASELIGMVSANLEKVVQHGKRADSIVKNMLLHSREGSGERSNVKVNAMVEEALNLAYHGARAEKPGFNVTIVKSLAPEAGAADLYAQEMTRVLLNLISNGFYATTKRRQAEANGAYEPTITASTRDLGDSVEIAVRDNGTGIPEEVMAKMFNPFFTTKPAGEGTGLGLSLSHDIVVKQHGGTLEVSTEPGAYTQFTIVLPRESRARDEK